MPLKYEPISSAERGRIIKELNAKGSWEGTRRGAAVRLVRFRGVGATQDRIEFCVIKGERRTADSAATVWAAVERCNEAIRGEVRP